MTYRMRYLLLGLMFLELYAKGTIRGAVRTVGAHKTPFKGHQKTAGIYISVFMLEVEAFYPISERRVDSFFETARLRYF